MKKLNLGCGSDIIENYDNIDLYFNNDKVINHDIKKLKELYEENSIDEIRAIDILEHIPWYDSDKVLEDWISLLKIGGEIIIQVPDILKQSQLLIDGTWDRETYVRNTFGGLKEKEGYFHLSGWTSESLSKILQKYGIKIINIEYIHTIQYNVNIKIYGKKEYNTKKIKMSQTNIHININLNENKIYVKSKENDTLTISILDWNPYNNQEFVLYTTNCNLHYNVEYWFSPNSIMKDKYGIKVKIIKNNNIIKEEKFRLKTKHGKEIKNQAVIIHCDSGLGDNLFCTPILKKIYEIYNRKITLYTFLPEVFINNPYLENIIKINDINNINIDNNNYEIHNIGHIYLKPFKIIDQHFPDIINLYAHQISINLQHDEKGIEFYPDECQIPDLPDKYIVINPNSTVHTRTWAVENWNKLIKMLENDYFVVALGKDIGEKKSLKDIEINNGLNLINQTSLSEAWNIINNSSGFISQSSGLFHLAMSTNVKIFEIASPTQPSSLWIKQNKEIYYIEGKCKFHCDSNYESCIGENGTINEYFFPKCYLELPTLECHPTPEEVFKKIDHPKIFCIGDSHTGIFKNSKKCVVNEIFRITASHVQNKLDIIDNLILDVDPKNDYILFSMGEIDCRVFLETKIKYYEDLGLNTNQIHENKLKIVNKIVNKYFNTLNDRYSDYNLIFWGPVASYRDDTLYFEKHINDIKSINDVKQELWKAESNSENLDFYIPGNHTCIERNSVSKLFNDELEKICEKNNRIFFTMFYDMIDQNMETKLDTTDGIIHLNENMFNIIKNKFNEKNIKI